MRFEALARRKEREALAAAIDPLATDVDCADDSVVAIGNAWSRALFDGLIFNLPELRVMLLTVPACTDLMLTQLAGRPWITPIVMPTSRDLVHAFRQLRTHGIATMSCIGGRTLAGQLLDAGLIQDVY